MAVSVCVRAGDGWTSIFSLTLQPDIGSHGAAASASAVPEQLRITDYTFALPATSPPALVFTAALPADSPPAAVSQFVGLAGYMFLSKSAGKPRAAVIPLPGGRGIAYLLPPASMDGFGPSSALRLCLQLKAASVPNGGAAAAIDGVASVGVGHRRPRPEDAPEDGGADAALAAGGARQRLRVDEAGTARAAAAARPAADSTRAGAAPAAAAAGPYRYRFLVYPDYVPDILAAPFLRRSAAAAGSAAAGTAAAGSGGRGSWTDVLADKGDRGAKGFWRVVEAAAASNDWEFVSKPAVLFKHPACPATDAAGLPATLHSMPLPVPFRWQMVNHMPHPRAISSKTAMWRALRRWYAARGLHESDAAVPTTFVLNSGSGEGFAAFQRHFGACHGVFAGAAASASASAAADGLSGATAQHSGSGSGSASVEDSPAVAAALRGTGERMPPAHCSRSMWIIKPERLLGGQGIELASTPGEVAALLDRVAAQGLRTAEGGKVAAGASWVVQKYLERPLLLCSTSTPAGGTSAGGVSDDGTPVAGSAHGPLRMPDGGRKFDVRVNVLVTDDWRVYVYEDGFCRTTSLVYGLDGDSTGPAAAAEPAASGSDGATASPLGSAAGAAPAAPLSKTVHVTNHCYQATSAAYGAYEPSNLLSFDQLQAYLDLRYGPGLVSVRGQLFPRWVEMILTMLSASRGACVVGAAPPNAPDAAEGAGGGAGAAATGAAGAGGAPAPGTRRAWFELIGVDFMIDASFRSWLIEANTSPGVEGHCPYADACFGRTVGEAAALTIDPLFPLAATPAPMPERWIADAAVAELPWAASVQRAPVPDWVTSPWRAVAPGADGAAAPPHPTLPRDGNRWRLVWAEGAPDLLAIPHQAAMAAIAPNAEAVRQVLAAEHAARAAAHGAQSPAAAPDPRHLRLWGAAAAPPPQLPEGEVRRIAAAHGLAPLLEAVQATACNEALVLAEEHAPQAPGTAASGGTTVDARSAAGSAAAAPRQQPLHWQPVLRRFLAPEDAAWLYPLGVPPGVLPPAPALGLPHAPAASAKGAARGP